MSTWGCGVETFKQAHSTLQGAAALGAVLWSPLASPPPAKAAQQKTSFKSSSSRLGTRAGSANPAHNLICSQLLPHPPTSSVPVSLLITPPWRQESCLNSSDSLLSMSFTQKCLPNKAVRTKTNLIFFLIIVFVQQGLILMPTISCTVGKTNLWE